MVSDIRREQEELFINTSLISMQNNMKKVWSGIRSIISIKKCKNSSIPKLLVNNKTIDNPADIANSFNKCFVNVGKITEQSIPHEQP